MTMPVPHTQVVELPPANYPMIVLLVTDDIVDISPTHQSMKWVLAAPHPFIPNMKVMRMFVDRGGVEVYSAGDDGKTCMRDLVPMDRVRVVQEAMPLDVFVDELTAAESGDDDDEDEPEEPEEQEETPEAPTNGQTASS